MDVKRTTQLAGGTIVLANAKGSYDFVEYHYYPETPARKAIPSLVQTGGAGVDHEHQHHQVGTDEVGNCRTHPFMSARSVGLQQSRQAELVDHPGLYAGQVLGEMMNDGVSRLTWWIGFGNCNGQAGNDSSSLYGWQDFRSLQRLLRRTSR